MARKSLYKKTPICARTNNLLFTTTRIILEEVETLAYTLAEGPITRVRYNVKNAPVLPNPRVMMDIYLGIILAIRVEGEHEPPII